MKKMKPAKASSTTSDSSVSSFNTVEKQENREADGKMAGVSFNFALYMNRKTLSRSQLTEIIQKKFDEVAARSKEYSDAIHVKMDSLLEKEREMR